MTDKNLFNVLKERGLLYQCTDEEALKKQIESGEPITLYEGTDPTADSLHIGHCVPYCILRRFQQAGHKVVLLMGGATACIGDPSGKQEMRKVMSKGEAEEFIDSISDIEELEISEEKKREIEYRQAVLSCEPVILVGLIKTIHTRMEDRIAEGKKVTSSDSKYYHIAEESLCGELAISLDMEKDDVKDFVMKKVEQ